MSPAYDLFFFILSPILALALGALLSATPLADPRYLRFGRSESALAIFSSVFTMAHLSIVFFRSHLNPEIRVLFPKRFFWAPVLVFGFLALSSWTLIFGFVLAVWWDVYHSALQTFGLGRLYDRKAGNDLERGRGLERALNVLLYAGPILAGAAFWDHAAHFRKFESAGTPALSRWLLWVEPNRPFLSAVVCASAAAFLIFYGYWIWRNRKNTRFSWQKALLYSGTAAVSLWSWGFNAFGEAFFIMNFFHSLQYFAIVWHAERERLTARFGIFAFAALAGGGFGYGLWATFGGELNHYAFSALLTVSLLHFWYDGFIWSVRRGQV